MVHKIDEQGFLINEASKSKIQKEYKEILKKITNLYLENLKKNLLSVYIRGSVSVGKAVPFISDIDSVVIIKKKISEENLLWTIKASQKLEKEYPRISMVELTIISLKELLKSREYSNLRVYLKSKSVCLYGKDILPLLPKIKPGKDLAIKMYGNVEREINDLRNFFLGEETERKYLLRKRSVKFWCIWTMRLFLRSGLGLVMTKKPVYSKDLKICYKVFSKEYPEYKDYMKKALNLAIRPTGSKKQIIRFIDDFEPKYIKLWQEAIKN